MASHDTKHMNSTLSHAALEKIIARVNRRMDSRPATPAFNRWLNTFVDEKGIDREAVMNVASLGNGTMNAIPVQCLIEAMIAAPANEQAAIKTNLVKIDFGNGDVMRFFRYLAARIAINL
jgi:hypothetical protein